MSKKLADFIDDASIDIANVDLNSVSFEPEDAELGSVIVNRLKQMQEVYQFTSHIADGLLQIDVPNKFNPFAGPIKDLYFKFRHLTWQANQVSQGDYSQRVDFMGEFSDSFNFMVEELDAREKEAQRRSFEKLQQVKSENQMLRVQMKRQRLMLQSYQDYTNSFRQFRQDYQEMMEQIATLFSQQKYDEAQTLISQINNKMHQNINIHREYSNVESINAVLMDIANLCNSNDINFSADVMFPPSITDYYNEEDFLDLVSNLSNFIFTYIEKLGKNMVSMNVSGEENDYVFPITFTSKTSSGFIRNILDTEKIICDSFSAKQYSLLNNNANSIDEKVSNSSLLAAWLKICPEVSRYFSNIRSLSAKSDISIDWIIDPVHDSIIIKLLINKQ